MHRVDLFQEIEAFGAWHGEIEHEEIPALARERACDAARRARLAEDRAFEPVLQDLTHAGAHDLVVVSDEDSYHEPERSAEARSPSLRVAGSPPAGHPRAMGGDRDLWRARLGDVAALAAQIAEARVAVLIHPLAPEPILHERPPLSDRERDRLLSLCRDAACMPVRIASDATADPFLSRDSRVAEAPAMRFFFSAPLLHGADTPEGVLCVADPAPRELGAEHRLALATLARLASRIGAEEDARRELDDPDEGPAAMLTLDAAGRVSGANRVALRWVGRTADEIVGARLAKITDAADAPRCEIATARALAGEPVRPFRVRLIARDGSAIETIAEIDAAEVRGVRSARWVMVRTDEPRPATEHEASQAAALELRARAFREERDRAVREAATLRAQLELALADGQQGAWEWDLESDSVRWHGDAEALLGRPFSSAERSTMREAVHPEDRAAVRRAVEAVAAGGPPCVIELRCTFPDGTARWRELRAAARRSSEGALLGVVGSIRDVDDRRRAIDALRAAERTMAGTLEAISDALAVIDPEWRLTFLNRRALAVIGREADAVVGADVWSAVPGLAEHEFGAALRQAMRDRVPVRVEAMFAPLGGRFEARLFPAAEGGAVAVYFRRCDVEHAAAEALARMRDELRALSARLFAVREEEAARLSREIHDGLGQRLTALKLDLAWLDSQARHRGPELERAFGTKIAAMSAIVDELFAAVRRMATELRPSILDDVGLGAAIDWQARQLGQRAGLEVHIEVPAEGPELDRETEIALLRILQEALSNVVLHARARTLEVRLEVRDGAVELCVEDDGRGIDERDRAPARSLGLLGMRERASMIGGELEIARRTTGGTRVTVRAPSEPPSRGLSPT